MNTTATISNVSVEDTTAFSTILSEKTLGLQVTTAVPRKIKVHSGVVSDAVYFYFETYVDLWLCMVIALLGVVTNSLTLAVFIKQGLRDSVNISMATVAFWDLTKCIGAVINRMYGPISWFSPAFGQSWHHMTLPSLGYLPIFAGYVSYALAAYIAFERCLCVMIPLKVKFLLGPKVTLAAVLIISIAVFGAYAIVFFLYKIVWIYNPVYNTTIAEYTFNDFYKQHGRMIMAYYKAIAIILPLFSFVIVVICSVLTVHGLRRSSTFRTSAQNVKDAQTDSKSKLSGKDKQIAKMLMAIIIVYIVNLFPRIIFGIAQLAEPEYYVLGRYHNLFMSTANCIFVLDFINASINLFIFYRMSSNFRATFNALRRCHDAGACKFAVGANCV
ncbi:uncharacterized protein LOC101860068 [Aplysia californica]|uniref:Uncharacterized protein LOC101860068 n=1 Tax=Aplysia californica TaxID=6500 RepID=A0ABM0KAC3_APLCA|nr:uncharacterized protein LOC101860068 [Aplysia californica]